MDPQSSRTSPGGSYATPLKELITSAFGTGENMQMTVAGSSPVKALWETKETSTRGHPKPRGRFQTQLEEDS